VNAFLVLGNIQKYLGSEWYLSWELRIENASPDWDDDRFSASFSRSGDQRFCQLFGLIGGEDKGKLCPLIFQNRDLDPQLFRSQVLNQLR
jgi:hypothetical protein